MRVNRWLIHDCYKRGVIGRGPKSDPLYANDATPFKARVEKSSALVRNPTGEQVVASYVMLTQTLILPEDRVWFPSIDGGPADEVANQKRGRTVLTIAMTMNLRGTEKVWQVYF